MNFPQIPTGLNKQELAAIYATNLGNFTVTISCDDDQFWRGVVTLKQTFAKYPILTARRDIKTWRNPADAIRFLQQLCPNCNDVQIKIGNWEFARF